VTNNAGLAASGQGGFGFARSYHDPAFAADAVGAGRRVLAPNTGDQSPE